MADDINMHIGEKPELRWVPKGRIFVDHNYQREIKPNMVQKILKGFDWKKFGCLSLVEHPDGRFSVYDGQHRWKAAMVHPGVDDVPGSIVKAESIAEEASAFLGVNRDRTAVTVVEKFWAGITAGDAQMIRIRDVLARAGCEVVASPGPASDSSKTNAVSAVERAINYYGERAVVVSLTILREAWRDDFGALNGTIIQAVARLARGNKEMDPERMREKLQARSRKQLTADAEAIRKISGGAPDVALAKTLVEIYNKGLQKNLIGIGVRG